MSRPYLFLMMLVFVTESAMGHEMRPAYLKVTEQTIDVLKIEFRQPIGTGKQVFLSVQVNCHPIAEKRRRRTMDTLLESWSVQCQGEETRSLSIKGLGQTTANVLVRFQPLNGERENYTLSYNNSVLELENEPLPLLPVYLMLGIEHLLLGFDHVLFVVGLMLLVNNRWKLVQTITSFTVAHSITLALSTFNIVSLSRGPVEAGIALSILYIAVEIAYQGEKPTLTQQFPWLIAFAFGLLHGLGFAGVLREIGLPSNETGWALLLFNLGIEFGQLLIITMMIIAGGLITKFALSRRPAAELSLVTAYGIGIVSTWWLLSRLTAIIS